MESLSLPSIVTLIPTANEREAQLTIGPLFPGYGMTVGNALRRVLLGSLAGAAVTAVRIEGVEHEFSTIEGVKEDVVDILLNIKRLRFRLHAQGPASIRLEVGGKKTVTAKNIEPHADVTIARPELPIATLSSSDARLAMDLTIEAGRGYVPTEASDTHSKLPLGTIAVDALFAPVEHVGYSVENVRVGQMTNYDQLVMTIRTDGTKTPKEVVLEALTILLEQLNHIATTLTAQEDPALSRVQEKATLEEPAKGQGETLEPEIVGEKPEEEKKEPEPKKRRSKKVVV